MLMRPQTITSHRHGDSTCHSCRVKSGESDTAATTVRRGVAIRRHSAHIRLPVSPLPGCVHSLSWRTTRELPTQPPCRLAVVEPDCVCLRTIRAADFAMVTARLRCSREASYAIDITPIPFTDATPSRKPTARPDGPHLIQLVLPILDHCELHTSWGEITSYCLLNTSPYRA